MADASVAVIGGSGLYEIEGLANVQTVKPDTPFGEPSDSLVVGELNGVGVAFLPRHGKGHRLMPTELPVRANMCALKSLGVQRVLSVSAVGSLREDVHPLEMVVPDQLIDRTRQRQNTFFGEGLVAHVGFADPFCPELSSLLASAGRDTGATIHEGGTYVVMEGPAFSTRAESFLYRSWNASVIGMTALPEAKLAREAEMCYSTLACVTDYDCWHDAEESVSVELVVSNLLRNVAASKQIIRELVPRMTGAPECVCGSALKDAIITARDAVPDATRNKLWPLVGKYFQ